MFGAFWRYLKRYFINAEKTLKTRTVNGAFHCYLIQCIDLQRIFLTAMKLNGAFIFKTYAQWLLGGGRGQLCPLMPNTHVVYILVLVSKYSSYTFCTIINYERHLASLSTTIPSKQWPIFIVLQMLHCTNSWIFTLNLLSMHDVLHNKTNKNIVSRRNLINNY